MKGIELRLERALKTERVIASTTLLTHLYIKLLLALFNPLADVNLQWLTLCHWKMVKSACVDAQVTCLVACMREIKCYKQPHNCSCVGAKTLSLRYSQTSIFSFCHLPTLITDILVWCKLYLEELGAVFAYKRHAVFLTLCTPEPGNNLSKWPSVLDHQCTDRNYIHSCKRTVTLRGLNSLGSCFHLLFASICTEDSHLLIVNIALLHQFALKLQF